MTPQLLAERYCGGGKVAGAKPRGGRNGGDGEHPGAGGEHGGQAGGVGERR